MRFSGPTLDDLCRAFLPKLLGAPWVATSRKKRATELTGVLLELRHPRARLSRTETRGKPFSCLGELLWYLSRGNDLDFIEYYIPIYRDESEDEQTVYGGYGPRLFDQRGNDQIQNIIKTLKAGHSTKRAVIQIFNAEDIATRHIEIPCTCNLQFLIRRGKLDLIVYMRSNDAHLGLPHDVFCFTMIQEIVARSVGVKLGSYKHFVGSLHLYECDHEAAAQYLEEGFQQKVLMPEIPKGDPWPAIRDLLRAEERIRCGMDLDYNFATSHPYWSDLVRMLLVLANTGHPEELDDIRSSLSFQGFAPYIEGRERMKPRAPARVQQLMLPF